MRHLSKDIRELIVKRRAKGHSQRKIASEFDCSKPALAKTLEKFDMFGTTEDLPGRGRKTSLSPTDERYAKLL